MHTVGIGIAGFGFMGRTHAHVLREIPLFYADADFLPEIRAVYARRMEIAMDAAQTVGAPFATDSFQAMLDRDDVQVVSICTPNETHLPMVSQALAAGKHVYVEKPMGMNAGECEQIANAVRASGKCLQVSQNNRFFASVMRAREIIDAGLLGDITGFRFEYLHSGSVDPKRPAGWKQLKTGGVLLDLASHAVDLMLYLAGDVESVCARTRILYPERPVPGGHTVSITTEDQATALVRLACGAIGTVEASKIATGSEDELSFQLHGTKGALRWNAMEADYLEYFDNTRPEVALGGMRGFTRIACVQRYPAPGGKFLAKNSIGWDRGHMHAWYSFLDALTHGTRVCPDAWDALKTQRVLDAMKLSAQTGATVML